MMKLERRRHYRLRVLSFLVAVTAIMADWSAEAVTTEPLEINLQGTLHTHDLRTRWAILLREAHPALRFNVRSHGTVEEVLVEWWREPGSLLLLERELDEWELESFERTNRYLPAAVPIGHDAAAVAVSADNPILRRGLGIDELKRILAPDDAADTPAFWGSFELGERWRHVPIRTVLREMAPETRLLRRRLLDGKALSPSASRLADSTGVEALAREAERDAKALVVVPYRLRSTPSVGVVPLADAGGELTLPSPESLRSGQYPLTSCLRVYIHDTPAEASEFHHAVITTLLGPLAQQQLEKTGFVALDPNGTDLDTAAVHWCGKHATQRLAGDSTDRGEQS